jgi:hypothetical protein
MGTSKSFYDLDYIVEVREKRVEQYTSAYQMILGRLANIIIIYSVFGIYLVPVVRDFATIDSWIFRVAVLAMLLLIACSMVYTIKLMWPSYISHLGTFKYYYEDLRGRYEMVEINAEMTSDEIGEAKNRVNQFLKASYIDELDVAQTNNQKVFEKKKTQYCWALLLGLMAVAPYLVCVVYHVGKEDDRTQKIEIVNTKNILPCIPVK